MTYFKIDGVDYSMYVNELNIKNKANYTSQTNAAGNTVCDLINHKRVIEVGIIPLDDSAMQGLQSALDRFQLSISFRDPRSGMMITTDCIAPDSNVKYYTIQVGKVMYKAFTIKFVEL